jgi:signal transduction histidine kinase
MGASIASGMGGRVGAGPPGDLKQFLVPSLELSLGIAGCLAMLAGAAPVANLEARLMETGFLVGLVLFLGWFVVRLDRGHLRLTMIGTQAAAMILPPPLAGLVGLVAGISWFRQGPQGHRYLGAGATIFWTSTACLIRVAIGSGSVVEASVGLVAVALWMTLMNWTLTLSGLSILTQEPVSSIARLAFSRTFFAAFLYFSLAAIVIANLMDGSLRGYIVSVVVAVLSVTLTETVAERRSREALEAQIADSQRHLGYSRAVEGVVHSLRHQLAITKGYVEDVLEMRLGSRARGRAIGAQAATDVALHMLDRLSASASPRIEIAKDPVNLAEIANASAEMVRGMAAGQRTRVEVTGHVRPALANVDPAMLREVVTELVINALQAVGHGGWVRLTVGTRRGGWASLSVADSGPGITDQQRDHLFEPHYTTKPSGTGMGLFTAFGIVREHGGQLIYEGGAKPGAVFTLLVPLAASSAKSPEPIAEPGDGLNPLRIS